MSVRDILKEELDRLNRLNVSYEKNILSGKYDNEPAQIVSNILAMCEIANKLVY